RRVEGRLATAPAWTAVEVARTLRRPRALATLDAALLVGACTTGELHATIREQKGRRGIVQVRELIAFADGLAESPMDFLHDRLKAARLQECGWTTIPMTVDDIRRDPVGLVARINAQLRRPRLAG
ncbi:MAG TPA: hypothetical protein VN741_16995, partial [Mycobacterium sp.]|nr:hypothetical protein [Mycobacterium sp.]